MPAPVVHVTAPSRLHFGLLSFGDVGARQFGGVGAMIQQPAVQLAISPAQQLEVHGSLAQRALEFAHRWAAANRIGQNPPCQIRILHAPPQHVGLGVGTQLGLSVAAGLNAFFNRPTQSPEQLALSVGRCHRSAVGTYGFFEGGLIAEKGKLPADSIAPLEARVKLPGQWRFVLIRPAVSAGLAGQRERKAFDQLPPVPRQITEQLVHQLKQEMLPAAAEGRFDRFSESIYHYGHTAGMCFAEQQGGPYNAPHLGELVKLVRELGVRGVGQSSWGPTLFALLPDEAAAEAFVGQLRNRIGDEKLQLIISAPCNYGAQIQVD